MNALMSKRVFSLDRVWQDGWTNGYLAERLGLHINTVSTLRRGATRLDVETMYKLREFLGEELFEKAMGSGDE